MPRTPPPQNPPPGGKRERAARARPAPDAIGGPGQRRNLGGTPAGREPIPPGLGSDSPGNAGFPARAGMTASRWRRRPVRRPAGRARYRISPGAPPSPSTGVHMCASRPSPPTPLPSERGAPAAGGAVGPDRFRSRAVGINSLRSRNFRVAKRSHLARNCSGSQTVGIVSNSCLPTSELFPGICALCVLT